MALAKHALASVISFDLTCRNTISANAIIAGVAPEGALRALLTFEAP